MGVRNLPTTLNSLRFFPILLVVIVLAMGMGWAQDSRVSGTVTDETGGVIPGVEVSVTNLDTGAVREAVTDDSGRYSVPQLFAGKYSVSAGMVGFETKKLELLLDPSQDTVQDFSLSVGAPSTVVEVSSTSARINVKPYEMATVIEQKQIEQLPLNGRNYLALATLSPGILKGNQASRGNQMEEGFKSGGLAMEHVAISLDGVDNTGRVVYGPLATQSQTAKPPPEAVAEFKIITNNTSAEYGAKAGATILITTKGGTNDFHGGLYWFHRNAAVSANNFMFNRDSPRDANGEISVSNPPYLRHQFGGTFGGPIIKDKTFFFFSFQGTRLRESARSFTRSVPSALALKGDFSQELSERDGRSPDIYDPLSLVGTGAAAERTLQFPNNVIPQNRIDPAAAQVLALYPAANIAGLEFNQNNYFYVQKNIVDSELYDTRIDHNFNDNHRIFGRFSYRNEDSIRGANNALPWPARAHGLSEFRTQQFALNYNATLGPRMHNEFRGGYSRFPAARTDQHTENLNAKFGIPNSMPEQYPERIGDPKHLVGLIFFNMDGRYDLLGGGSPGGTIVGRLDTMTVADNFLWDIGNHNLKFGVEYRRWDNLRSQLSGNDMGQMNFDGRYTAQMPNSGGSRRVTGHSIADSILGVPRTFYTGLPVGEDMLVPYWGFYVQDDWRITPRLTLNLGLRYELFLQPRIKESSRLQNAKSIWDVRVLDETSPKIDVSFVRWKFPQGSSDCGCIVDKNNWAPRIGLAYRITNSTVIRAGAGLYFSENSAAGIESNRHIAGGPVGTWHSVNTGSREVWPTTVSQGFTDFEINEDADPTIYAFNGVFDNVPDLMKTINVYQWFLDIQHQLPWDVLMTVGYNGTSAHNLPWWRRNWNVGLGPSELPANHATRRRLGEAVDTNTTLRLNNWMTSGNNMLNSNYNAFTFKLEKRFSQGISFTNAFTWSKGLDYGVSSINERTEGIVGGAGPLSPYAKDLWRNYGKGGLSRDYAYALSLLYELPAGPGKGRFQSGPASWLLGGWQLGSFVTMQSGPWATTTYNPNTQNTGGSFRGFMVGELNRPSDQRDSINWWNSDAVAACAEPPCEPGEGAGQWGNVGRGVLELHGFMNWDFLLSKDFQLPMEGHRIQFRFEAFNFTNTAHLGNPGNNNPVTQINASSAIAEKIFRADLPRIIQFALKYNF